ncbi:cation diffusion facilitator 10 [Delphinella strobiligena]|nr:cation diffusion facilitator 10 [Delphinella strobiligena]
MSSYGNDHGYGTSGSPPKPSPFRIPALKGFLPLSEETSLSTRGQKLPGLIRERTRRNSLDGSVAPGMSPDTSSDLEAQALMARRQRDATERQSAGVQVLLTPQMRSMRLIGNSNPRYRWEQYWKDEEELKKMSKPLRQYYERNNYLIQQYIYIDRLLDSSLPHNLIQEYQHNEIYNKAVQGRDPHIPPTLDEEPNSNPGTPDPNAENHENGHFPGSKKVKRTPKALYRHQDDENTPLLNNASDHAVEDDLEDADTAKAILPAFEPDEETSSSSPIVTVAIYINLVANTVLLAMKIVVTIMTSSVSVLASLVDAALDFLSTAIVWITTRLISHSDQYSYPVGRRRLEPIGVLVFAVVMITSFIQVALEGISKLQSGDHEIVQLSVPAIAIMAGTVIIKFGCWLWCRFIKNSSVQALAQDAMTDVVFNIFSIIFPLIGFYARIWWLDPLGGILLSFYVIINWSRTCASHIRNLTGAAATADERNVLLYLTMRFAKSIRQIQGLQAYHAGDALNVEVDIVLDEGMSLRDSHDLGESLQYVLESVPGVERAFVHQDYASWNLPSHMQQDDDD